MAVVGTTASGKSDLAIQLAQRLDGEVVSADSRQVYRGLDVGAGKVTPAERALVPHHLLDVADLLGPPFTVVDYQRLALAAVADIAARGRLPILAGGSGLYVRAVVDSPSYPEVPPDPALRAGLEAQPLEALVARLQALDPEGAATLDLRNPRRVVRALETTLASGVPFSQLRRAAREASAPAVDALLLGLTYPREALRARIEARLETRLQARPGLLDEVRGLLDAGVPPQRLLDLGLEYRFVTRHLLGELDYAPMVAALATAIGQFARRQLTWFRRDGRIHWLDPTRAEPLDAALGIIRPWLAARLESARAEG